MRAAIVPELNVVEIRDDVTTAELGPREVKIRMKASGICRTDLSAFNGTWPSKLPLVLGHEGAGEIIEVGSDVARLSVGQRVILAGLVECGTCSFCRKGQPFLCSVNDMFTGGDTPRFRLGGSPCYGMVGLGTWAEEMIVPENMAVPFDPSIPHDVAAVVGCAVLTGVGAVINTVRVEPGASVAVVGCGGIGSASIQGARLAGAGIILAVEPAIGKHDQLKRFGATHVVTPDQLEAAKSDITGGDGFDYVFEAVGRPETIRAAWDITRRGGSTVISGIGAPTTPVPFNAYELSMDAKHLVGSVGGSVQPSRDFPLYLQLWQLGKLDLKGLITSRIGLSDAGEAMKALNSGADITRQVIIFD